MSSAQGASVPFSHVASYKAVRAFASLVMSRYGAKAEVIRDIGENYIVLSNHTTRIDPWILARACKDHAYFVAAKDLMQRVPVPTWDKLLDPIFISLGKGVPIGAVRDILRRAWNGHNIILFPEGHYTLDGVTSFISRSTASLVKKARCALVTYRTTGGYLQWPTWADTERRGPVQGSIAGIYSSAQLAQMTVDEIHEVICSDLDVNAYALQKEDPRRYLGRNLAEGIERVLAICPSCGRYFSISSKGDVFMCDGCRLEGTYDEYGFISGRGFDFDTVEAWIDWQKRQFMEDDRRRAAVGGVLEMPHARLMDLDDVANPKVVEQGRLLVSSDGIAISGKLIPFDSITNMAIGYHAESLLLTSGGGYYEIEGDKLPVALIQYAHQRFIEGG